MKTTLAIAAGFLICTSELAVACGGSSGGSRSSGLARGSISSGQRIGVAYAPVYSPMTTAMAQVSMARQSAVAQANAYSAAMRPIRLANAQKAREQKLARRQAFKETMLARAAARKQKQQEFLASAREWTDVTGKHKTMAVLADANDWGVKLKKQDGSLVNVRMDRLSQPDQYFVASVIDRRPDLRTMFAGL